MPIQRATDRRRRPSMPRRRASRRGPRRPSDAPAAESGPPERGDPARAAGPAGRSGRWPGWRLREEPGMRAKLALLTLLGAMLMGAEGCAPVPLPRYAAFQPRRVDELLVDSENMRQIGDEWERFWFLDQPSHMTPWRTHGGLGF